MTSQTGRVHNLCRRGCGDFSIFQVQFLVSTTLLFSVFFRALAHLKAKYITSLRLSLFLQLNQ